MPSKRERATACLVRSPHAQSVVIYLMLKRDGRRPMRSRKASTQRQEHIAEVGEVAIRLRIERLKKMWLSRNQS